MKHRAGINQHRTGSHFSLRNLFGFDFRIIRPFRAARHNLRRAILSREIGNRPNRIELRFDMRQMGAPRPAVAMDRLRCLTATNPNDLRQMKLHFFAIGAEESITRFQNALIHNQRAAFLRPHNQSTGARGQTTAEIISAIAGRFHIRVGFCAQCRKKIGTHNIIQNQRAIFFKRVRDGLYIYCAVKML